MILLLCCSAINAQQIFSSSGRVITNGNLSLSYTIGEPLVSKETNGNIVLSNGFQNAIIATITKIKNNLFKSSELLVYPNPSSGILNIENKIVKTNLQIQIYTLQGQQVFHKNYEDLRLEQLNLSQFSNGVYLLSVEDTDNKKFNTYKIQLTK